MTRWTLHHGDALDVLRGMPDASVDAVVTDPPAGIAFMGKEWDGHKGGRAAWVAWLAAILAECYRVTKPGGRLLCWSIPRTSHWTGCAVEDAGWLIENTIAHMFGSGFPKGRSQLKPAREDWWLARKPGGMVPPLRIDECRIATDDNLSGGAYCGDGERASIFGMERTDRDYQQPAGRWPANVLLSHADGCAPSACVAGCPVAMLDAQSGCLHAPGTNGRSAGQGNAYGIFGKVAQHSTYCDTGTASRFFQQFDPDPFVYQAKASRRDRNAGCEGLPEKRGPVMNARCVNCGKGQLDGRRYGPCCDVPEYEQAAPAGNVRNHHPTVKPTALMQYLVRLIAAPGAIVLDPFTGSGSTGRGALLEGCRFVGIERDPEYIEIARARLTEADRAEVQQPLAIGA